MHFLILLFTIGITFVSAAEEFAATNFQRQALNQHNMYRAKHNTPPLRLNATISAYAQEWANYLASRNSDLQHRSDSPYGENVYQNGGAIDGKRPVDKWYAEIDLYDYSNPEYSKDTGHFTQVVWVDSKQVGIGMARSVTGATYVVANYSPPGNSDGGFEENVRRPS